ncbi:MAG: hypothetical protein RL757_817 [Bacteroidota bacterium]
MKRGIFSLVCFLFAGAGFAQTAKYAPPQKVLDLLQKHGCVTCHKADKKAIGPAFYDISKKGYTDQKIVELIAKPQNNWKSEGYPPMAPLPNVPKADGLKIAKWVNSLKSL